MPESLGSVTKSIFLVGPESHKLALEFSVAGHLGKLVFSADVVADDTISGKVGGIAITPVAYSSSHDATMALLVTALKALTAVTDAKISPLDSTNRTIVFYLDNQVTPVLADWLVASTGAGTAVVSSSTVLNDILQGMPIAQLGEDELILGPVATLAWWGATVTPRVIGVSMHYGIPGQFITAFMKGYTVIYCKLATTVIPGPAKVVAVEDVVTTPGYEFGYLNPENTAVTTNQAGWLLDSGDDNDIVRLLLLY